MNAEGVLHATVNAEPMSKRHGKRLVRMGIGLVALLVLGVLALAPATLSHTTADRLSRDVAGKIASDASIHATTFSKDLPLSFEPNRGQTDRQVRFLSRVGGYNLFLTATEAVFALPGPKPVGSASGRGQQRRDDLFRITLKGANSQATTSGVNQLPGVSNYFIKDKPGRWRTDIPTYGKVRYADIYPGIDLTYYGTNQQLEYDFEVSPGIDPGLIRLVCHGATPAIDGNG